MQKVENYICEELCYRSSCFQSSFPLQKLRRGVTRGSTHQPPTGCLTQHSSFYSWRVPRLGNVLKRALDLEPEDLSSSPISAHLTALCPVAYLVWASVSTFIKMGLKTPPSLMKWECIQRSLNTTYILKKKQTTTIESSIEILVVMVSLLSSNPCHWNWLNLVGDVRGMAFRVPQRWWHRGLGAGGHGQDIPLRGAAGTPTGFCDIATLPKFCK